MIQEYLSGYNVGPFKTFTILIKFYSIEDNNVKQFKYNYKLKLN